MPYLLYTLLLFASMLPPLPVFMDGETVPKWYFSVMMTAVLLLSALYGRMSFRNSGQALGRACVTVAAVQCAFVIGEMAQGGWEASAGAKGTFDNPAGLALFICCMLPPGARALRRRTAMCVLFVAVCFAVVWLSKSRTGIICLAAYAVTLAMARAGIRAWLRTSVCIAAVAGMAVFALTRKSDSTLGRRFILERTWEMISEKPLAGHGIGGFRKGYMDRQADFFAENAQSRFAWLADEVRHPLNEFAYAWVELGIAGLMLLTAALALPVCIWMRRRDSRTAPYVMALTAVGVFAMFSYPLNYPIGWMVMALNMALATDRAVGWSWRAAARQKAVRIAAKAACWTIIPLTGAGLYHEHEWGKAAFHAERGHPRKMLPRYERLSLWYGGDPHFIYNHAVVLYTAGMFGEARERADECGRMMSGYNIELLKGDIERRDGNHEAALERYRRAEMMCPVRFAPLEGMMDAYMECGKDYEAAEVAERIMKKRIKVHSPDVERIRKKALLIMEKMGKGSF